MQPKFKIGQRVRLISAPPWWPDLRLVGTLATVVECDHNCEPRTENYAYVILAEDCFERTVFERRLAPVVEDIKIRLIRRSVPHEADTKV